MQSAIDETYSDDLRNMVVQPGLIAQIFLDVESVQRELKVFDPEARQQRINATRWRLAYSEAQIELVQERDQARNARWDNGLSYMAARQQLIDQLKGIALNDAIADLQLEYFKHETQTIAIEEESGFFRYQPWRVFGRN